MISRRIPMRWPWKRDACAKGRSEHVPLEGAEGADTAGDTPDTFLPAGASACGVGCVLINAMSVFGVVNSIESPERCVFTQPRPNPDIGQLMIRRAAMGSGAARLDGGRTLHFL